MRGVYSENVEYVNDYDGEYEMMMMMVLMIWLVYEKEKWFYTLSHMWLPGSMLCICIQREFGFVPVKLCYGVYHRLMGGNGLWNESLNDFDISLVLEKCVWMGIDIFSSIGKEK